MKFLISTHLLVTLIIGLSNAQNTIKVRLDHIDFFVGEEENKIYFQIPQMIEFGLSAKKELKVEISNFVKTHGKGTIQLNNLSKDTDCDYTISCRIYERSEFSLNFEIAYQKGARNTSYLEPIYAPHDNLLSGCSKAVEFLHKKILELNASHASSRLRFAILAENEKEGRSKIEQQEVSGILDFLTEGSDSKGNVKFLPWDSTRDYSFRGKSAQRVLQQQNALILLIMKFEKDKKTVVSKLNLFYKTELNSIDSIRLSELRFGEDRAELGTQRDDLYDLVGFLITGNTFNEGNLNFLKRNENNLKIPTKSIRDHLDSAATDSTHYFKALFLANKALSEKPEHYETYFLIHKIREGQGRYMEAIRGLLKAAEFAPDAQLKAFCFAKSSILQDRLKNTYEAINLMKEVEKLAPDFNDPEIGEINYLLGGFYGKVSSFDESISRLLTSTEKKPNKPGYWPWENYYSVGYAYYFKNDYKRAASFFERVYNHDKSLYPELPKYLGDAYYRLAQMKFLQSKYDSALGYVTQSLSFNESENAKALELRSLNRLNKFEEARVISNEKTEREPEILKKQAEDMRVLFYVRKLRPEYGEESIYYYLEYLKQRGTDSVATYRLGNVYASLNLIDPAILFLEKAVASGYKEANVFLDLAEVYIKAHMTAKVMPLLNKIATQKLNTPSERKNYIIKLYLSAISMRILKEDYTKHLQELRVYLDSKKKIVSWNYESLENWVPTSGLQQEDQLFIKNLTDDLKKISY